MIAQILNEQGDVINTIVADAAFLDANYQGRWVEVPAAPTDRVSEPRHITRLAFRSRFTQAELIGLEIAGLDDPNAAMPARQLAAAVRVMQRQVAEATYIDLDRADTRAGVQQLESVGLLATGRALQILDAEIQPIEVYQP